MITASMFAAFLLLMILRFPVEIAVGLAAVLGLILSDHGLTVLTRSMVGSIDSFVLVAVPFFILAGHLMNVGGVTDKIFAFARAVTGHLRGGLAQVNIAASMLFAGMSGAAVADLAALGPVEIKAMKDYGYSRRIAAAVTLASCTIGPIIPPSIVLVVYGLTSETSIGRLFLAGIVPGILIAISLMVFIYIMAGRHPEEFGDRKPFDFREVLRTGWAAKAELLTPVIVIALLVFGIATPTEVAVFAVLYALLLGVINRQLTLPKIWQCLVLTLGSTSLIMYLIAVSTVLGEIVIQERQVEHLAEIIAGISDNPLIALLLINVFLLMIGMVLDNLPALIICSTILLPIVHALGIDPVHFGIVICYNLIVGIITPPMGVGLYITARVAQLSVEEVLKAVTPFFIPLIAALIVITLFPQLSLFLPNLVFGELP
jgi:tripartite ATP-independent transporter DctM subunit